jgi:phosphatidylglycerol---prolipoprotein diacylglyceryl transferase
MYPTISDFIKDAFGINLPLPIQSFGFFVAISFILAAYLLLLELKRKEKEGIISAQIKQILIGKPASTTELIFSGLIGFILGYKIFGIFLNYSFFAANPQYFVFSSEGNFLGGILGAAAAAYLRYREKQKSKLDKPKWEEVTVHPYELTGNFVMLAALAGIIGAKIFHNLENIDDFIADPIGSLISFSGLTFFGGLIVAAIVLIWYARKNKIPALVISDAAAPTILLAYAIGRIGCHVAGDGDWGIVNEMAKPGWLSFLPDWLWAYNYPHNVINEGIAIPGCIGKHCFELNPPVFPTPIYETIVGLILFAFLWGFRKKMKTAGMMFFTFLIMTGVERFLVELIRVNTKYHIFGYAITQAELIAVALVITGIAGIIWIKRKQTIQEIKT